MSGTQLPPLSEALRYCGRRLLAELEHDRTDASRALTAVTHRLLQWWFCRPSSGRPSFHPGQREAILHTILAHEVFASDDPDRLRQLACEAWPTAAYTHDIGFGTDFMAHTLRLVPGTGLRWVVQALLLWQWLNARAARNDGLHDPRFDHRFLILTSHTDATERILTGLLGRADAQGCRDPETSSWMRHVDLFVPPELRTAVREWLDACAHAERDSPEAMSAAGLIAHHHPTTKATQPPAILSLATGIESGLFATGRPRKEQTGPLPAATRLLWIDIVSGDTKVPSHVATTAALAECTVADAIRNGSAKACILDTQVAAQSSKPSRQHAQHNARPVLRRVHRQLLQAGIRQLQWRTHAFLALNAERRPRLRVLCEDSRLQAPARRFLEQHPSEVDPCDLQFDTFPSARLLPDAAVCVVVVLRKPGACKLLGPANVLTAGLPLQWREPELTEFRRETTNTIERGRAPQHAIDVLCVVEDPQHHDLYDPAMKGRWMVRGGLPTAPVGDLTWAEPRHTPNTEFILPKLSASRASIETPACATTRVLMRIRDSLPTSKSCRTRAAWPAHDHGLIRGLIEAAEGDPDVIAFWLAADWANALGKACDQTRSALSGIDIVVRTEEAMLLTRITSRDNAFQTRSRRQHTIDQWCRDVRKLPPSARSGVRWHAVQLLEPMFWSEKRAGTPLSTLLLALAGTTHLQTYTSAIPAVSGTAPVGRIHDPT